MKDPAEEQMCAVLLRGIANVSGDMIAAIDTDFGFTFFNEAYRREYAHLWKLDIETGTNLLAGMAQWPEEREKARDVWQRALDGDAYTATMEFGPSAAEMRYYALRFAPIMDGDSITGAVHIISDITAQVRAENHREILIRELNHRVKNTLAMVQVMARQSFRGSQHLQERERFEARLSNLASAHDMLTNTHWEYTSLDQVISSTMAGAGVDTNRVTAEGDHDLILGPEQAVSMSMALHELATNALKYGALSTETGRVSITWTVNGDDDQAYDIVWQEEGGPSVSEPDRAGFGTTMVRKALANDLQGDVELVYAPDGVICRISGPLSALQQSS
ncbi:sensor histidine kinase [Aquisalinus flavus]|uniref:histidine kinase n=1 Tax=Aquisalinus flavus TaxID=1526572 RepID=A0A8J2V2R4_9PROT|nr:PAS domain-containing sensor histidine kinase [Aquisalinus flavus]MBD0427774.1 PAS domain-containing protein [Aquisalinus flavus]GGD03737.1 sensor histidine kinase [Aquisalinus flavus]